MGFFDWLAGATGNVTVLDDVIWLTQKAKFQGISRAIVQRLGEQRGPAAVFVVAHFSDCLEQLRKIVEQVGASNSVMVVNAASLMSETASMASFDASQMLDVLAAERHPLAMHDETILNFARALPCQCRLVHHVSLDDPVIQAICGEWVEGFLKKLGMAEDEAIESKLVSRRIKATQEKFGSQCLTDYPANSAKEWLKRNCPQA